MTTIDGRSSFNLIFNTIDDLTFCALVSVAHQCSNVANCNEIMKKARESQITIIIQKENKMGEQQ